MRKIKTTGELREFLCEIAAGVEAGKVEPEKARNITKLAAQVNESFYSEIKVQQTAIQAGQQVVGLGDLAVNK
jgi:hypothetical protein